MAEPRGIILAFKVLAVLSIFGSGGAALVAAIFGKIFIALIYGAISGLFLRGVVLMDRRDPATPGYWMALYGNFFLLSLIGMSFDISGGTVGLVWSGFWFAYWFRSRRVQLTYAPRPGVDSEKKDASFSSQGKHQPVKTVVEARRPSAPAKLEEGRASEIRVERECPHCAERILANARLCKHCHQRVDPVS